MKIFIDPGHGGHDPGAVGNGLREKGVVLTISRYLRDNLNNGQTGVQVRMSRDRDTFVSLGERARMANRWGADYFVSVHVNAGGGAGFETYIYNGNVGDVTVSRQSVMHREMIRIMNFTDRGQKRANFAVLRETRMPAILTENGFIDHTYDARKLRDPDFLEQIALAHAQGIEKSLGLTGQSGSSAFSARSNSEDSSFRFQHWDGSIIRHGDQGKHILELQKRLLSLEYRLPRYGPDGIFGSETSAAVRQFQLDAGIGVDGVPGPETYQVLEQSS